MTTPTTRLDALEAEAFRAQHHQVQVAARLDHITAALGDLSQNGRAVAFDVREIKTDLTEIRTGHGARLAGIEAKLANQGVRLDGMDSRLDDVDSRLDRVESTLTGHGELLRAILARVGGQSEQHSDT